MLSGGGGGKGGENVGLGREPVFGRKERVVWRGVVGGGGKVEELC
jgi:hypothetical protein